MLNSKVVLKSYEKVVLTGFDWQYFDYNLIGWMTRLSRAVNDDNSDGNIDGSDGDDVND